jgi:hypothetical protein
MKGTRTILFGIAAVTLVSLCLEPLALAQRRRRPGGAGDQAPQQDEATTRAREAYERGRAAFTAGNFQEALTAFQEAYDAKPHPTVLVSIAECQERLEQWSATVETLERYLRDSPQARDREAMEQKIAAIRARPAVLNVTSEPPGAKIFLDGTDTGKVTPSELEVAPGDHTIKLTLDGHVDAVEQITVTFAERRDMPMTLDTPEPEETTGPEETTERHDEGTPVATYIGAGLTGVGLVAGTVFGFMALSEKSDFDDQPTADAADRGERFALIADVSFGVAVAAGIATAILIFTKSGGGGSEDGEGEEGGDGLEEEEEEDPTQDEDYVRLRVLPLATRGGGGLSAQVEF